MNLPIALLPLDIAYADPAENLRKVSLAAKNLKEGVRLLVLPELFTTGYLKNPEKMKRLAALPDGPTVTFLRQLASLHDIAIAGSFLANDNDRYFNRAFLVLPGGDMFFYDKRHLFTYGGEDKVYTAGSGTSPIVDYRGWRIKLAVCYDLRFPCWCRNRPDDPYDILLFPSNWPEQRAYPFRQLLIARAIENQACVVGANRSGSDPSGDYPRSMSMVFDHMGMPVGEDGGDFIYATLNRDTLSKARRNFPVMHDADTFSMIFSKKVGG